MPAHRPDPAGSRRVLERAVSPHHDSPSHFQRAGLAIGEHDAVGARSRHNYNVSASCDPGGVGGV